MAKKKTVKEESTAFLENQTIVRQKIADLKVNKRNADIYNDDVVDDLMESIILNDMRILVPLVVTPDGTILSGHRRFKAAKALGIESVNTIVENVNEDDMDFRIIQYNVHRKKKYSEILNEIDRLYDYYGRHQGKKRNDELPSLGDGSSDVTAKIAKTVGLSTGNMSYLQQVRKLKPEYIAKIDTGETTIKSAYIKTKKETANKVIKESYYVPGGQLTGNIDAKVFNKSCEDMTMEIDDNSVQCIFTSPPYYKMRDYEGGIEELGQEKTPEKYIFRLSGILKDCHRVLKEEGSFFLNLGDCRKNGELLNIPHRVLAEVMKHGYHLIHSIIWTKINPNPVSDFRDIQPSYETIFHLVKNVEKYTFNEDIARPFLLYHLPYILKDDKKLPFHPYYGEKLPNDKGHITDYWPYHDILRTPSFHPLMEVLSLDKDHPAPMSSLTPILPILLTTNEKDTVLDVFSGSATTGMIAILNGRNYRGYEINNEYYDLSVKKLKLITGEEHKK
jgi:DNA modification methylase